MIAHITEHHIRVTAETYEEAGTLQGLFMTRMGGKKDGVTVYAATNGMNARFQNVTLTGSYDDAIWFYHKPDAAKFFSINTEGDERQKVTVLT